MGRGSRLESARTAPELGFSIRIVAARTGISAETLRVWERRYGFPRPGRRAGGGRLYTEEDIAKLRLIARGREAGYRPGDLLLLDEKELVALVDKEAPHVAASGGASETLAGVPDFAALMSAIARDDVATLRRSLRALAALHGPQRFVTDVADPLMVKLGESWACGAIGIRHEHLASHVISTQLRLSLAMLEEAEDAVPVAQRRRPAILLATLPGEAHVLGLEMVALYMASRRAMPRVLGADTPPYEIARAADAMGVPVVGVSISPAADIATTRRHVEALGRALAALERPPELWLGGSGAEGVMASRTPGRLVATWAALDDALRGRTA